MFVTTYRWKDKETVELIKSKILGNQTFFGLTSDNCLILTGFLLLLVERSSSLKHKQKCQEVKLSSLFKQKYISWLYLPVMTATRIKRRRPIGSPAWFIAYGKPGFKKENHCRLHNNILFYTTETCETTKFLVPVCKQNS